MRAARITGVPPEAIEKAARWFATCERGFALHARGIEHQSKGVENVLALINICLATGNIGREGAGCVMITGQGNGQGGREHGQKCDQLPGQRSISDPEARKHVAKVWGIEPDEIPQAGYSAVEIMEAIHRGEIKGLLSICFNPLVSLPDANFTREALEKLEFFGVIDFFMSETARHADVVLAGSLQEEEEGVACNVEGRVIHIQQAVTPPGDARIDSQIICDLARRLGRRPVLSTFIIRGRSLTSCEKRRAAGMRTTTASPTKDSTGKWVCSGPVPPKIIREHRGCLRAGDSFIPMERRGFSHGLSRVRRSGQ